MAPARVVLEIGPHSPWISRLLTAAGYEVIVANPGKLRRIWENDQKCDRADAEYLARVGRLDPRLLAPVRHRGEGAQADLAILRSRAALVRSRTALISHVRGAAIAVGGRLPSCGTPSFHRKVGGEIPEELKAALLPLVDSIGQLSQQIAENDRLIKEISKVDYPETALLRQVPGMGPVTALCYILTLEDPDRSPSSRLVEHYLGLVPRKRESGDSSPQLRTTKAGDPMLRHLLIQAAHYTLGPSGEDTDLRRWGEKFTERGGNNAKKRAIGAVARKLAILLHSLWSTGEVYQPLRNSTQEAAA